jgi:septum formation protein
MMMKHSPAISPMVLASASERRAEILKTLGVQFIISPTHRDETPLPAEEPESYTRRMAREKAEDTACTFPDRVVLGADTTVSKDGRILGKPATRDDAREYLMFLSGAPHQVITATCFIIPETPGCRVIVSTDSATVWFSLLSPEDIEWYLDRNEWRDAAGAYQIQNAGGALIRKIEGEYGTVVGLPIRRVYTIVRLLGLEL